VRVDFGERTAILVRAYAPTTSDAEVMNVADVRDVKIDVPDHVLVLEITL
jgi:hypothetical protein